MSTAGTSNLKRKVTPNKKNEENMKASKIKNKTEETHVDLKSMKKIDLVSYCENLLSQNKDLMAKNETLIEMKDKHIDEINNLKNSVKELKEKCSNTPVYLCGDCDYVADCIHDFTDHTHSPDDFNQSDLSYFQCNFCEETFDSISEVMNHNKQLHTSHVQHCHKFLEDECYYGDKCWFLHSENHRNSSSDFQCRHCDSKFKTKTKLMKHMKTNHIQYVSQCKNETKKCKYGPEKCWFTHTENIEQAYKEAKNSNI